MTDTQPSERMRRVIARKLQVVDSVNKQKDGGKTTVVQNLGPFQAEIKNVAQFLQSNRTSRVYNTF